MMTMRTTFSSSGRTDAARCGVTARLARAVLLLLPLAGASCAKDARISVNEMKEREDLFAAVEAVKVQQKDIQLTDIQPYRVRPGDVLSLTLIGLQDPYGQMTIQVRVHDKGEVSLPLAGEVKVGGESLEGVEKAIVAAYVPKYVKSMSAYVQLVSPEGTTVVVTGAAANRGIVTLSGNQRNVLYALALSGGFTQGISGVVRVRPIRSDQPEYVYNLFDVNDLRRILQSPPLQSGDMIIVEAAPSSVIYTMGLLNSPGPIAVPPGTKLSVTRAVAAAGGLMDMLDPEYATLWRNLGDGKQVRVKVSLAKIMAGEEEDLLLQPGDILEVPHTLDTRARAWFLQNIRVGPFSVGTHYDPLAQWNTRRALRDDNNGFRDAVRDSLRYSIPNLLIPQVPTP